MTRRFEVDYKQRLEQSRTASNAVRLPRLGYAQYRVYDIEEKSEYTQTNYKMTINKSRSSGPLNVISSGRNAGKSHFIYYMWHDVLNNSDLISALEPQTYTVKWLKPKHVTLLRMKGHQVEPADPGDKSVRPGPVRLGR